MSNPGFYVGDRPADEYEFSAAPLHNHSYLAPAVLELLGNTTGQRIADLGCGNGTLTARIAAALPDRSIVGVENSPSGLAHARTAFPSAQFVDHDLGEPLPDDLRGKFDVVLAAEVIEHLFLPRQLFARADEALAPGGQIIVTTPFHGYWKNLALALAGKYDVHWRPGWDYGHIKFFSQKTLGAMAEECGYEPVEWKFVGRVPQLAKSMLMRARRRS